MKQKAAIFKKFLEDNHVFDEYVENLSSLKTGGAISKIGMFSSLSQFLEGAPSMRWITSAFFHHKTRNPQMWGRLAAEWESMLKGVHSVNVIFLIDKFIRLSHMAKDFGITPEQFIQIAVDKYIEEVELNIQKAKENGNNNQNS